MKKDLENQEMPPSFSLKHFPFFSFAIVPGLGGLVMHKEKRRESSGSW
jgi:hypothetical protein